MQQNSQCILWRKPSMTQNYQKRSTLYLLSRVSKQVFKQMYCWLIFKMYALVFQNGNPNILSRRADLFFTSINFLECFKLMVVD